MKRQFVFFAMKMSLVFLYLNPLHANPQALQQESPTVSAQKWAATGLGFSNQGLATGLNFSIQKQQHLFMLRAIHNLEFEILGSDPAETVWDIGILYGRRLQSQYGYIVFAGGVSLVGGINRGSFIENKGWFSQRHNEIPFTSVGLPVACQFVLTPFRYIGLGLHIFGNLNFEKSFAGFLITLELGQLK